MELEDWNSYMIDEDKTGVHRTKPPKPGYRLDTQYYIKSLDWVQEHILEKFGSKITRVIHDPELDIWRFYEGEQQIVTVNQDLLDRISIALEKLDWKFEDMLDETLSEEAILHWIEEKERGELD